MNEELLDFVNEKDQVIGVLPRTYFYHRKIKNFRTVHLFIKNHEWKLWIPRRTFQKKLFPGGLDCSMWWHVMTGETYLEAFFRETKEELGIDMNKKEYRLLGYINPFLKCFEEFPCFTECYEYSSDEVPTYNPDDFSEYYWLFPHEILTKLTNPEEKKQKTSYSHL